MSTDYYAVAKDNLPSLIHLEQDTPMHMIAYLKTFQDY